ncbi:MAG: exodeoxyribonuclease VII large subunit, partial [Flavobacteriales bacterium]|nr:exodeoxyribonuclease VII large subunit [Flavobacteriales bacterium]
LQGDKAIESIRRQLDIIRQRKDKFDVLAIIRGGGGEVGLSCYDSFSLASAVAQYPLPIITGIGHATNLTIVEMVSYQNLITPTALANFILEKFEDFDARLKNAESNLAFYSEKIIKDNHIALQSLAGVFETDVMLLLQKEKHLIETLSNSINLSSICVTRKQTELLSSLSIDIKYLLKDKIQKSNFILDNHTVSLKNTIVSRLINQEQKLNIFENKVKLLNPDNILKRGYAIARVNGSTKGVSDIKEGDLLEVETFKTSMKTKVEEVNKK